MDMDFSSIVAIASATAIVGSIMAMGVVKFAPNFAKWGVNKLVGMFR